MPEYRPGGAGSCGKSNGATLRDPDNMFLPQLCIFSAESGVLSA